MSRSEGLRSTGAGSGGFSTRASKLKGTGSGRSLADLASRFTSGSGRSQNHRDSIGHSHREDSSSSSGRLGSLRGDLVDDKKVVRYTREKLLSMRPRPDPDATLPSSLNNLEGTSLLSKEALDPVCWDNFDANEIWSQAARERSSRSAGKQAGGTGSTIRDRKEMEREERRSSFTNDGGGADTWRRGVALPPAGEGSSRRGRYDDAADNPEDLWDDPSTPQMDAAADFSAFGGALDGDPLKSGSDAFDLAQMSEAAKKFEENLRGGSASSDLKDSEEIGHDHAVNPTRPLASAGTTIRSGSGDDVNVFEDFGEPDSSAKVNDKPTIKSGDEQTASSRLMQMIGVTNDGNDDSENSKAEEKEDTTSSENVKSEPTTSLFSFSSGISKNPWGDPTPSTSNTSQEPFGLDLAAKLREKEVGMQNEAERLKREEMERIRLMEVEEEKRRVALLAQQQQQQAELLARQQAAAREQQKQSQQGHSQIELILTERISTILENSWGRSDLVSVLSTLHNEDSRVVPLLGSIEALSALIARHPRRFALTKDPSFGTDVVVLLANNAQWQQQQQQQMEDLQRRQQEEHQKMLAQQEAARAEAEARARQRRVNSEPIVITNSPWYYADPQGNVQGPFGGEEMRQWLEAGYFKGDLPISQDLKGQFRPLSSLFPDIAVAFKPSGPSEAEQAAMAKAEEEAKIRAEAEAAAEAKAREAAEKERAERERAEMEAKTKAEEEAAAAMKAAEGLRQQQEQEAKSNQTQSAQLKMLLGLGGASSSSSIVGGIANESTEAKKPITDSSDKQTEQPQPQSKISKSKDSKKSNGEAKPEVHSAPAPTPAPAWGGAGTNKPAVKKKSMSEIQKEEARVAARVAKQKPQNSGGWANIAASGGTTAWSGSATAISSTPSITSASSSQTGASIQSRSKQQISGAAGQKQTKSQSSTQKTMEEFGANGKMTPALEEWCKNQMRKLSGSDDLTLIAFCMTLSDPVEIKGYLTAYLGSTPQVNNFATEFINRKNGTKQQEQWETTGGSKKGRKKKGAVAK